MKTKRKEIVCIFVINVKIETKIRNIWQESLFYINMSAIILQLCNTKTVLTLSLNLKHGVLDFFLLMSYFTVQLIYFLKKVLYTKILREFIAMNNFKLIYSNNC